MMMGNNSITLSIVGISIRIDCDDHGLHEILARNFEAMNVNADVCELEYRIQKKNDNGRFVVSRPGSEFQANAKNVGELIYLLEGDLVVKLQLLRPNLLFLHSAVVSDGTATHLFTGPSGAGKSTICWGLLHHGFRYLSDELAPVDLQNGSVAPYPHALCLKSAPPSGYQTPTETISTERGLHIPPSTMPSRFLDSGLPIGSIFFVKHQPDAEAPAIRQIGTAEAATRLYPNILNALAHKNDGLGAALQLVRSANCYRLDTTSLAQSCALIKNVTAE